MWLLLVAAGAGYVARCWQKARKCKPGFQAFKHNAGLYISQSSPSCTPRRGRSRTASRRGSRRRSQSAKSRKLLSGRCEGKLARNHARDWDDETLGSSEKFCEELLSRGDDEFSGKCYISGRKDQHTSGQVQISSQTNNLHGNNHMEPYLSVSALCMQDQWRETSSCKETPLPPTAKWDAKEPWFCICAHSDKKPIFETLHGCCTTVLDFLNDQRKLVASSSGNRLDCLKPTETSLIDLDSSRRLCASPSCLQIPRIKTTLESKRENCIFKSQGSTQAPGFFAKMARELGQSMYSTFSSKFTNRMGRKSCLKPGLRHDSKEVFVFRSSSYRNLLKHISEKEMGPSSQRDKNTSNTCALHSCLLKAPLDPEYLDQRHRFTVCRRGNDHENEVPCLIHCTGLGMTAVNRKKVQKSGANKMNNRKNPKGQATGLRKKPTKSSTNHLLSTSGSAFVALGITMGVAFGMSGCKSELEDLNRVLKKTSLMIEELKKQMDSKYEFHSVKQINNKKVKRMVPSEPTMLGGTCSWKAHRQYSESDSQRSVAEFSSMELFSADKNDVPNNVPEKHLHGLNELEAELEAELQRMELNIHNSDLVDYEWSQTQQESQQPEGGDSLYVDIEIQDSMAVQDEEQAYESDFVVPPLELERRLWQVLEQRHEDRICELENDLHVINERVAAKEVEVQWWKDRVWWLMETRLGGNDNSQSLPAE